MHNNYNFYILRVSLGDYYGDSFPKEMLEDEVDAFLAQKYAAVPDITRIIKFEYFDWDIHTASPEKRFDARYFVENYNRAEVKGNE